MEAEYLIYRVYNEKTGKSYIGTTYNLKKRITQLKTGKTEWKINFREHPEDWSVIVLDENLTDEEADRKKLGYISLYDTIDNGYNRSVVGLTVNKAVRDKQSDRKKGKKLSDDTKKKISDSITVYRNSWNYRKKFTDETKMKMSSARAGKIFVNNGIENKLIYANELKKYKDLGYTRGILKH